MPSALLQQKPKKFQDWGWCWKQNEIKREYEQINIQILFLVPSKDRRTVFPGEKIVQTPGTGEGRKCYIGNWKMGKICLYTECWHSNPISLLVTWNGSQGYTARTGQRSFLLKVWPSPKGKDLKIWHRIFSNKMAQPGHSMRPTGQQGSLMSTEIPINISDLQFSVSRQADIWGNPMIKTKIITRRK